MPVITIVNQIENDRIWAWERQEQARQREDDCREPEVDEPRDCARDKHEFVDWWED